MATTTEAPVGSATWDPATTPSILEHQASDPTTGNTYSYWQFAATEDGIISVDTYLSTYADGSGIPYAAPSMVDVAANLWLNPVLQESQAGAQRNVYRVAAGKTYRIQVEAYGKSGTSGTIAPVVILRTSDFIPASTFVPVAEATPVAKTFTPDFGGLVHALPDGDYTYATGNIGSTPDDTGPVVTSLPGTVGGMPLYAQAAPGADMAACEWSLARRMYRQPLADTQTADAGYLLYEGTCPAPVASTMWQTFTAPGYSRSWYFCDQYREFTSISALHQSVSLHGIETFLGTELHQDPSTMTAPEGQFVLDGGSASTLTKIEVAVDVTTSTAEGNMAARWYAGSFPIDDGTASWGPTRGNIRPTNDGTPFDPSGKEVVADISTVPSDWVELDLPSLYAWERDECGGTFGVLLTGIPVAALSDAPPADLPVSPASWKPTSSWWSTTQPVDSYSNARHQFCAVRATVIPPVNQYAPIPEIWDPPLPPAITGSLKSTRQFFSRNA